MTKSDETAVSLSTEEIAVIPGSPATAPLRQMLTALAEAGSTGALHVDGSPGGTWYLVSGRITHASSPACPDVGERLVGSGRLAAQTWQDAYDTGYADRTVGQELVRGGHLVQGELVCRVLATICDATHAILQSDDAPVRFVPGERHWLGQVTQIELTALSRETARRRLLVGVPVETPLTLQDLKPERVQPAQPGPRAGAQPGAQPGLAVPVPAQGRADTRPDGPWAGRGRTGNAGPATVDAVPGRRGDVRTGNAGPQPDGGNSRFVHDYATLKRIRRALTSIG
jgi:hypothetical protein